MFKRGREGERERGREGERERGREGERERGREGEKENIKVYFFLYFLGCFSEPNDDCQVMEVASNTTKKCIFPFLDETWKEHYGCTADVKDIGKFWCSTKVESDDKHISEEGYWGHCGENCYIEEKSKGEMSLS
jgi:hypothetical protein